MSHSIVLNMLHARLSLVLFAVGSRVRLIPCRHPIPDTIGRSYTDTDTELYNFFVLKM